MRRQRRVMRALGWILLALALLSVVGGVDPSLSTRAAWAALWLGAAAFAFRLSRGSRTEARLPRPRTGDPDELILLCERRIGRSVEAAARVRVKTPRGARTHALALAAGYLWWIELRTWPTRVGVILLYLPLEGLAGHTQRRRRGRHRMELSWPCSGELFLGTLHGPGTDRLAGLLAAEQFSLARACASEELR